MTSNNYTANHNLIRVLHPAIVEYKREIFKFVCFKQNVHLFFMPFLLQ